MISIISPVYNTKKYLPQLIKSVVKQSYQDWELLFVEDCGTDGAYEFLKQVALSDNRIKVFKNEKNKGVDFSRFTGLSLAKGEYIMFVDSDDWLGENALINLLNEATKTDADIVYGAMSRVLGRFSIFKKNNFNTYLGENYLEPIENPQLFEDYFISYFGVNKLTVSIWGKLYKKSTLDKVDLKPSGYKMGEDLIFNMYLHPYLNKVSFIPDIVYYYRWGGMTNTFNPTFLSDIKKQYVEKLNAIQKYNYQIALPYINYELANCFYSHFLNQLLLENISYDNLLKNIKNEIADVIYSNFLNIENKRCKLIIEKKYILIADQIYKNYQLIKLKYKFKKILSNFLG